MYYMYYMPCLLREGAYHCAITTESNKNRGSCNIAGESHSPTYSGNNYRAQMPNYAVRPESEGFKTPSSPCPVAEVSRYDEKP